MALPKRRHSLTRGKKRRTHYRMKTWAAMECPNCSKPKKPHCICSYCGYYDGKEILSITEKA